MMTGTAALDAGRKTLTRSVVPSRTRAATFQSITMSGGAEVTCTLGSRRSVIVVLRLQSTAWPVS